MWGCMLHPENHKIIFDNLSTVLQASNFLYQNFSEAPGGAINCRPALRCAKRGPLGVSWVKCLWSLSQTRTGHLGLDEYFPFKTPPSKYLIPKSPSAPFNSPTKQLNNSPTKHLNS
jgi:hypothetical protein